jgi:general secretion pathway protein G
MPQMPILRRGFTVIELMVVLAAIAMLLALAGPRYIQHLDRAREVALREDLHQMREAIDKFYGDQRRYPAGLEELVSAHYLRQIPDDPVTRRADSWVLTPPAGIVAAGSGTSQAAPVFDVHSGASGNAADGTAYASW